MTLSTRLIVALYLYTEMALHWDHEEELEEEEQE
jgi:hypothetical protein